MQLSIKLQQGLLLVFFIQRNGGVTLKEASTFLEIEPQVLKPIARKLVRKHVLRYSDDGGIHEISGDPHMIDVINAIEPIELLSTKSKNSFATSRIFEQRVLMHFSTNLGMSMMKSLMRRVRSVVKELAANEAEMMKSGDHGYLDN